MFFSVSLWGIPVWRTRPLINRRIAYFFYEAYELNRYLFKNRWQVFIETIFLFLKTSQYVLWLFSIIILCHIQIWIVLTAFDVNSIKSYAIKHLLIISLWWIDSCKLVKQRCVLCGRFFQAHLAGNIKLIYIFFGIQINFKFTSILSETRWLRNRFFISESSHCVYWDWVWV